MINLDIKDLNWNNLHNLDDNQITYLLYLEGKSIDIIAKIRNLSKIEVEKQIIKGKITIDKTTVYEDLLVKVISMSKDERINYLMKIEGSSREILINDILKRYIKFKNHEDKMIIIWVIGELKDKRLLPILRMELKSKSANVRRLSCSALGKIKDENSRFWLEPMLKDTSPQVRQYAIKALSYIGDNNTLKVIENIFNNKNEKEYVKRAAYFALEKLKEEVI